MSLERIDAVVIGAGVVGLAVARGLARAGREVVVLEAATAIGTGTSSRNSEVIHAGLYYPTGSLKARLCVRGRELLYAWCAERGVAHRRCGKLIVATHEGQLAGLQALQQQALANGVADVQRLTAAEARALEPQLQCVGALLSPSTGIVDSHGLMLSLQGDAEAHGAMLAFESPVLGGRVTDAGIELDVGGAAPMTVLANTVVNAAGLDAPVLAGRIAGLEARHVPQARFSKGSYFSLAGKAPFSRLVYPMHAAAVAGPPQDGGAPPRGADAQRPGAHMDSAWLGVHLTLDLAGQARFGPDAEWLPEGTPSDRIDYRVDPARGEVFYEAVRRYWRGLPDGALLPAYAGVRPKIHGPGEPAPDFRIDGLAVHGVPGLVNLFGIESPGLTSALAIGEWVLPMCDQPRV